MRSHFVCDARRFDWLGTRMESEDNAGITPPRFAYLLTPSTTELGRTDFDGKPRILDKEQRSFVSQGLRNFLDQVGEVYSQPRVAKEATKQGLRAKLALDVTTGWNFDLPEHRRQARSPSTDRQCSF